MKKRVVFFALCYLIIIALGVFTLIAGPRQWLYSVLKSGTRFQPIIDLVLNPTGNSRIHMFVISCIEVVLITLTTFNIGTIYKQNITTARVEEAQNDVVYQKTVLRRNGRKVNAIIIEESTKEEN